MPDAPDKVRICIPIMNIISPNPIFDHLSESSRRDDSNKWSNIGFGEELKQGESIEVNFTHLIWSSETLLSYRTFVYFPGKDCEEKVSRGENSSPSKGRATPPNELALRQATQLLYHMASSSPVSYL